MIKMQNWLLIPVLGLLFCVSRMKAKEHMLSLQNKARFPQLFYQRLNNQELKIGVWLWCFGFLVHNQGTILNPISDEGTETFKS